MPIIRLSQQPDQRSAWAYWIRGLRRNIYSQGGEDQIIAELFEIMGIENRWCVEFGAWDGSISATPAA
ncbi:MAG: hypothetical protein ACTS1X_12490 [Parasphingopyxis sp.]|uniref:hypothetical protein n=1 Tax=Parasphingopyxis sp. TaxID=1920299 RepID=UPI003FA0F4D6